jgi:hypothetical protein
VGSKCARSSWLRSPPRNDGLAKALWCVQWLAGRQAHNSCARSTGKSGRRTPLAAWPLASMAILYLEYDFEHTRHLECGGGRAVCQRPERERLQIAAFWARPSEGPVFVSACRCPWLCQRTRHLPAHLRCLFVPIPGTLPLRVIESGWRCQIPARPTIHSIVAVTGCDRWIVR